MGSKFQCDLFASFGACDRFLFVNSGTDENCHLFGPGKESMADYLTSCNLRGSRLEGRTTLASWIPLQHSVEISAIWPAIVPKDVWTAQVLTSATATWKPAAQ